MWNDDSHDSPQNTQHTKFQLSSQINFGDKKGIPKYKVGVAGPQMPPMEEFFYIEL